MTLSWQDVEDLAQQSVASILGDGYKVTQTGGFNSNATDLLVKRLKDGKTAFIEVKKTPSIAGFQAVVKLDDDGKTFIPSQATQGSEVSVLCDIINNNPIKTNLTTQDKENLEEIFLNVYQKRNIKALFYYDTKRQKSGICPTEEIADNFKILVDKPRNKASGSGRLPVGLDKDVAEMMRLQGFSESDFVYSRVGVKMLIKTSVEAILRANGIKNGKGYGLKEFNGWLPQLSATTDDGIFELRKRSKTANPTILVKLSGIVRTPSLPTQEELEKILF